MYTYTRAPMDSLYRMPTPVQAAPAKKTRAARRPTEPAPATGQAPDHPDHAAARTAHHGVDLPAAAKAGAARNGRRIQVRRSGVHGKGVFALQALRKGEYVATYRGEPITWQEALRRHPHDPSQPDHTFYFHIDDEHVIDGKVGGNAARWINHSCAPNCIADDSSGEVHILALRHIRPGEELFYDYGLIIDERYTPKLKQRFACRCGAKSCRGTMLAPKRAKRAS
jgi:uncharacterized protein